MPKPPHHHKSRPSKHDHRANTRPNTVRIIGGQWRGRKITFHDADGLRPTGDRLRETLFNWLNPYVEGAACLDLFAGSGALGLEALSRGAKHCDFVDTNPDATRMIQAQLNTLLAPDTTQTATVHTANAETFTAKSNTAYDILFLDPPFAQPVDIAALLALPNARPKPGSLLYIESGKEHAYAPPTGWAPIKQKTAGAVSMALYRLESLL